MIISSEQDHYSAIMDLYSKLTLANVADFDITSLDDETGSYIILPFEERRRFEIELYRPRGHSQHSFFLHYRKFYPPDGMDEVYIGSAYTAGLMVTLVTEVLRLFSSGARELLAGES